MERGKEMSASLRTTGYIFVTDIVEIDARQDETDAWINATDEDRLKIKICFRDSSLYDLQHAIEQAMHKDQIGIHSI